MWPGTVWGRAGACWTPVHGKGHWSEVTRRKRNGVGDKLSIRLNYST